MEVKQDGRVEASSPIVSLATSEIHIATVVSKTSVDISVASKAWTVSKNPDVFEYFFSIITTDGIK